jgi:hypothetical protein
MSNKSWKDFLLSSGLPLEYAVSKILANAGAIGNEVFHYQRRNELNIQTDFSVDIESTYVHGNDLWLEMLVECKYRHDSSKWVFTPAEYRSVLGPEFNHVFLSLDDLADDYTINTDAIERFSSLYRLANDGVEILTTDANSKSIANALCQLKYAIPNKIASALEHQIDHMLGDRSPIFIILPIVVTTAELWRIRPEQTISQIRKSQDISDIADREDILILYHKPDNELRQYSNEILSKHFSDDQKSRMSKVLSSAGKHDFDFYTGVFSTHFPSMYVIIHFDRFESAITNVIRFFSDKRQLKKK